MSINKSIFKMKKKKRLNKTTKQKTKQKKNNVYLKLKCCGSRKLERKTEPWTGTDSLAYDFFSSERWRTINEYKQINL